MSLELINVWYIVAAALFIFGLKQLGSPATAVRALPTHPRRVSSNTAVMERNVVISIPG